MTNGLLLIWESRRYSSDKILYGSTKNIQYGIQGGRILDYFEPEAEHVECQHHSTRKRWHTKGGFKFQAETCLGCGAYGWTNKLDEEFDVFLSTKNMKVSYHVPPAVAEFMVGQKIGVGRTINYFLGLVSDDDELLDWIDSTYGQLYARQGWGVSDESKSSVVLTTGQYKTIAELAASSGKTMSSMVRDIVSRTVGTAMYLNRGQDYLIHRRGFLKN